MTRSLAIALLLAVAASRVAADTATLSKTSVTANRSELLTVTLPGSGQVTSLVSLVVGGGDALVVGGNFAGPDATIQAIFTVSGAINPAPVDVTVNTATGARLYTASLTVNPAANGAPVVAILSPAVSQGQTTVTPTSPIVVSGQATFPGPGAVPEVFFINRP
jgi:hypothetical protein